MPPYLVVSQTWSVVFRDAWKVAFKWTRARIGEWGMDEYRTVVYKDGHKRNKAR
jgi:hypothetical protein